MLEDFPEGPLPPPTTGPLSWRDVYQAVAYSERRVLGAIEQLRSDLQKASDDHEVRMRTLEGLVVTKVEFNALELRVEHNEDRLQGFTDRERGVVATLKGQRDFIMFFVALISVGAVLFLNSTPA